MKSEKLIKAVAYAAFLSVVSCKVAAADCQFEGKNISIGETVSLADPYWIKQAMDHYREEGYSEEKIDEILKFSDWTHLVLECVNTFVQANIQDDSKPFGMVDFSKPAMVPLRHQVEWVNSEKDAAGHH
ncbi:hypothetical protein [Enterovibrio norvegicus]|uniref:Uncharacterized protein n=1 Tax=Enterovibrio norvegicus TaxID=188144 RepID=A0ABV4LBT1_9GAMM